MAKKGRVRRPGGGVIGCILFEAISLLLIVFCGVIIGVLGAGLVKIYLKYVLFAAGVMGMLLFSHYVNIHWSRQRKHVVQAYNSFGVCGLIGLLVGVLIGLRVEQYIGFNNLLNPEELMREIWEKTIRLFPSEIGN